MTDIYCIQTIQHSGSRFVRRGLFGSYERVELGKPPRGHCVYFDHLHWDAKLDEWRKVLPLYPIVAPLRHPRRVFKSWEMRRNSGTSHKESRRCQFEWLQMIELVDKHNPYYVPVDSPDRDAFLARINEDLGFQFTTDWMPQGIGMHTYAMPLNTINLSDEDERFIESISDFVDRYWRDTLETEEITSVTFRNLTDKPLRAYQFEWQPNGREGDSVEVSDENFIEKFKLYANLEVVKVEQKDVEKAVDPFIASLTKAVDSGFKVDRRWREARLKDELEAWRTQQHN